MLCEDQKQQVNDLFLLGAGFSKALLGCNVPLNTELLDKLIQESRHPLQDYRTAYGTQDIEILLTRLDLEISSLRRDRAVAAKSRLEVDRETINSQIAEYFRQFRFGCHRPKSESDGWLESLATEVFAPHDVIVSLNYDCFLEGLLDQHGVWCPATGYGAVKVDVPGASFNNQKNPKNILIYKIHGSENFHTTKGVEKRKISLAVDDGKIYPKSGKGSNLGVVGGEPYIIAPSFVKTFYPQIQRMMVELIGIARRAKDLVIIGCSLRLEDSHLWLILTSFISSSRSHRRLIVVDRDAEAVKRKIRAHYRPHACVESIGQGRGLDGRAVNELISKLRQGNMTQNTRG